MNLPALLMSVLLSAAAVVSAQPDIRWDKTFGGESYEELNALLVQADGFVAGGSSRSNIAFGNSADFSWNVLITKFDFDGNLLWQHLYGGDQDDRLWSLIQTKDGGFLAGGYSYSGISGDKTQASRGDMDVWMLKLDAQGQLLWEKSFGGLYRDELFSMLERPEGGFILGCNSWSDANGDKTENARGTQDFWIIAIDEEGNKLWDKTIGGSGYEQINDLIWAPDGNVYLSGGTTSVENNGEIGPSFARGGMDFLLIKFDPETQQVLWTQRHGGAGEDYPYALVMSPAGTLWMGGRSGSAIAAPTQYNNGKEADFYGGDSDFWLLELDLNGQKIREWSFGGTGLDDLYTLQINSLGQVVLGGVSDSGISGNKTTTGHGGYDYWLIGLDSGGQKSWEKTIGGAANDAPTSLAILPNGAMLIGGHSESNAGFEKSQSGFGLNDFWILVTDCDLQAQIYTAGNPNSCEVQSLEFDAAISGCTTCHYLWNTGETGPAISHTTGMTDTLAVFIYNELGCVCYDTMVLMPMPPLLDLGPIDTLLLHGNHLSLGGNNPDWQYHWNTGSNQASILVNESGTYALTVTNENDCTASDAIQVAFQKKSAVWVPNVFSPDYNGINDFLSIYADETVQKIGTFRIYDRWGDLCFYRDNFTALNENDGWDGLVRNETAPSGVYSWLALVVFLDGSELLMRGDVTILR